MFWLAVVIAMTWWFGWFDWLTWRNFAGGLIGAAMLAVVVLLLYFLDKWPRQLMERRRERKSH